MQVGHKLDCPAKIYVYEHVVFPQYAVSITCYQVTDMLVHVICSFFYFCVLKEVTGLHCFFTCSSDPTFISCEIRLHDRSIKVISVTSLPFSLSYDYVLPQSHFATVFNFIHCSGCTTLKYVCPR